MLIAKKLDGREVLVYMESPCLALAEVRHSLSKPVVLPGAYAEGALDDVRLMPEQVFGSGGDPAKRVPKVPPAVEEVGGKERKEGGRTVEPRRATPAQLLHVCIQVRRTHVIAAEQDLAHGEVVAPERRPLRPQRHDRAMPRIRGLSPRERSGAPAGATAARMRR